MDKTFKAPEILNPTSGFCAGCGHGIINRIQLLHWQSDVPVL